MKIGLVIRPFTDDNLKTALQMDVKDVITTLPGDCRGGRIWDFEDILRHKKRIEDIGLRWSVVESVPISDAVKLGLDGRDEEIDDYCQTIRNLGAAGIPTMCYNWMAVFGWMRTSLTTRTRGDALAITYDHREMENAPEITEYGEISEERLWENLEYFLKRVIPVAEEAGVKQGMHPDDPPMGPISGRRSHYHQSPSVRPATRPGPQRVQRTHLLPGQLQGNGRRHRPEHPPLR